MMSDEYLVECKIDDDDDDVDDTDNDDYDEEVMKIHPTPTPPPQFCSSLHNESRDPYGVNNHLREPHYFYSTSLRHLSMRSLSGAALKLMAANSGSIGFESARIWSYRCLTALFAVPLSCFSGCLFAVLACFHVWCLIPCVQVCHTCLPCVRSLWMSVVNIFIMPLCISAAHCCSRIYIIFSNE